MTRLLTLLLLGCTLVRGATYYVRTDGNNANTGLVDSAAGAWRNVWYAAGHVSAGDTVQVGAGEFYESVTNTVSGTLASPITFLGVRSGTNWLTIIDSTTLITNPWVAATEIGAGVWKQTGLPFETHELYIGNKRVCYTYTTNTIGGNYPCTDTPALTNGINYLMLADDSLVNTRTGYEVDYWDALGALWASVGSTTYLRIRDGSDPSSLSVRIAPNRDGVWSTWLYSGATISMNAKSNIVWQDFKIRSGSAGIYSQASKNITIRSNLITGGMYRFYAYQDGSNITLDGNDMFCDYYAYGDQGAWEGSRTTTKSRISEFLYEVCKYLMGQNSQMCYDMRFYTTGTNTVIANNYCHQSLGNALYAGSGAGLNLINGMLVYSNRFEWHPSTAIVTDPYITGLQVYDNHMLDCNAHIRLMHYNQGGTDRTTYFFRNKCYNPHGEGENLFFHVDSTPVATYFPPVWIYQNSFAGGNSGLNIGGYPNLCGGLKGVHILNNIFSDQISFKSYYGTWSNVVYMATNACDYNLIASAPLTPIPGWWGSSNIIQTNVVWTPTFPAMTFALPDGCAAIDAGEDLPTDYPALPQDGTAKVGAQWDMGRYEYEAADAPLMALDPVSHDYGTQQVDSETDFNFEITNDGTGNLDWSASGEGYFTPQAPTSGTLAASASANVTVRYKPLISGTHTGTITFTGGGGASAAVNGVATNYVLPSPPRTLTVGRIAGTRAYDPTALSGLQAWWDFGNTATVTTNGDNISQITDLSGGGHTLTNGVAANQPTWSRPDNKANWLKNSETFATTWTRSRINAFGATDTGATGAGSFANTTRTLDPLGGNTADFIQEDSTAANDHGLRQASVLMPSGVYTASCWVKPAGRTWVQFYVNGAAAYGVGYFDVQNGVVGTVSSGSGDSGASGSITSAGNGWYLCALTWTASTSESRTFRLYIAEANNDITFDGDNTSGLFLWGASLIPSSADAVTGPTLAQGYVATTTIPAYQAQNGRRIVHFDGVSQFLKAPTWTLNQPETVIWVGRQITWTSTDAVYDGNSITERMKLGQQSTTPNLILNAGSNGPTSTSLAVGAFGVVTACFNGASGTLQVNNGSVKTGDVGNHSANGFTLASRYDGGTLHGNIETCEILIYNRALTTSEITWLANGLANKWGITF